VLTILVLFCSKTVTALDVVYALKRSGRTLYGFGA
jgi:histone H4